MAQGRGAWTTRGKENGTEVYARINNTMRDGAIPDNLNDEERSWYECVGLGVTAIQRLVGMPEPVTGLYGRKTKQKVKDYQLNEGLYSDGRVGFLTMRSLLRPVIIMACGKRIDPRWIYALARQESGLDPGAQGWSTPGDRGVWQFNTSDGTPTPEQAHDVVWAADAVCKRWLAAWAKYAGKGSQLRVECSIMQHRSPVAADHLYNTGTAYGPESAEYVRTVSVFADSWDN